MPHPCDYLGRRYSYRKKQLKDGHLRFEDLKGLCVGWDDNHLIIKPDSKMSPKGHYHRIPIADVKEIPYEPPLQQQGHTKQA